MSEQRDHHSGGPAWLLLVDRLGLLVVAGLAVYAVPRLIAADLSAVQVVAGVLLILGCIGFAGYARHAFTALTLLRANRVERERLRGALDRLERRHGAAR